MGIKLQLFVAVIMKDSKIDRILDYDTDHAGLQESADWYNKEVRGSGFQARIIELPPVEFCDGDSATPKTTLGLSLSQFQ